MRILERLFGKQRYAVIVRNRVTRECFINSTIYDSLSAVEEYKQKLECNQQYIYVRTISYRE